MFDTWPSVTSSTRKQNYFDSSSSVQTSYLAAVGFIFSTVVTRRFTLCHSFHCSERLIAWINPKAPRIELATYIAWVSGWPTFCQWTYSQTNCVHSWLWLWFVFKAAFFPWPRMYFQTSAIYIAWLVSSANLNNVHHSVHYNAIYQLFVSKVRTAQLQLRVSCFANKVGHVMGTPCMAVVVPYSFIFVFYSTMMLCRVGLEKFSLVKVSPFFAIFKIKNNFSYSKCMMQRNDIFIRWRRRKWMQSIACSSRVPATAAGWKKRVPATAAGSKWLRFIVR